MSEQTVEQRIALEKRIVRKLVRHLRAAGWEPVSVYNGGEWVDAGTESKVLEEVFSVDDSWVAFGTKGASKRFRVLLIVGNGEDIVSDWTYGDEGIGAEFGAAMDAFLDVLNALVLS